MGDNAFQYDYSSTINEEDTSFEDKSTIEKALSMASRTHILPRYTYVACAILVIAGLTIGIGGVVGSNLMGDIPKEASDGSELFPVVFAFLGACVFVLGLVGIMVGRANKLSILKIFFGIFIFFFIIQLICFIGMHFWKGVALEDVQDCYDESESCALMIQDEISCCGWKQGEEGVNCTQISPSPSPSPTLSSPSPVPFSSPSPVPSPFPTPSPTPSSTPSAKGVIMSPRGETGLPDCESAVEGVLDSVFVALHVTIITGLVMELISLICLVVALWLTRHRESISFYDDFELTASFLEDDEDDDVSLDDEYSPDVSLDEFDY